MSIPWLPLSAARVFSVVGKDARRYLHNRLSHDINNLAIGAVVQAAALSAQGRIEGFFSVKCLAEDRFLLVSDGGDAAALRAVIAKYIVADRVVVTELHPAPAVIHIATEKVDHGYASDQLVAEIPRRRIASGGVDLIIQAEAREDIERRIQDVFGAPISQAEYFILRWKEGVPVFPDELNESAILTECGMREAVSFSKGCYVGQEVIERGDAIGKLPRALEKVLFGDDASVLEAGASVLNSQGEAIGKLVSSAKDASSRHVFAFAMLRTGKYSVGDMVTCQGAAGVVAALRYGR